MSPRLPKALLIFWAVILAGAGGGIAYLQYLGPPQPVQAALPVLKPLPKPAAAPDDAAGLTVQAAMGTGSALPGGAAIPPPQPKLLAASAANPKWLVPQIAPDGQTAMQVYAASISPPPDTPSIMPGAPRIALLVAGLGVNDALTLQAASTLPPPVSLALIPYGQSVQRDAAAARDAGHEIILVLPLPGLIANEPAAQNLATLDWSMSQVEGYAGVTDAFGQAMGGGFMADAAARSWLMTNIARRGLFFIDGNQTGPVEPFVFGRNADVVLDPGANQGDMNGELGALLADAQSQHSALGIMLNPTPDALNTLATWTKSLVAQDIQLVPVSALVLPPETLLPTVASTKP